MDLLEAFLQLCINFEPPQASLEKEWNQTPEPMVCCTWPYAVQESAAAPSLVLAQMPGHKKLSQN